MVLDAVDSNTMWCGGVHLEHRTAPTKELSCPRKTLLVGMDWYDCDDVEPRILTQGSREDVADAGAPKILVLDVHNLPRL